MVHLVSLVWFTHRDVSVKRSKRSWKLAGVGKIKFILPHQYIHIYTTLIHDETVHTLAIMPLISIQRHISPRSFLPFFPAQEARLLKVDLSTRSGDTNTGLRNSLSY